MTASESWASAKPWREFFDLLSDAVLVLDTRSRVAFANTAALRLLPCDAGTPVAQLAPELGEPAVRWLTRAALGQPDGKPPLAQLRDGRSARFAWQRLDARYSALRFDAALTAPRPATPSPLAASVAARDSVALFWDAPFPAALQDAEFRFVDVNAAFAAYSGFAREQLIGRDGLELLAPEDQAAEREARARLRRHPNRTESNGLTEGRLIDASNRERWYRIARRRVPGADGATLYLAVLQDTTSEHVARERADRSIRELDDWFDLSPIGMVLFDETGLLVRSNPAFDAVAGKVPVTLAEAEPSLRELLAWGDDGPLPQLQPGSRPIESQGWVAQPNGEVRRLRAIVRCYRSAGGQRRYMGVVEDRSVEEERDLARLQIGALMDTAGVGLATFQETSGWVRPPASGAAANDAPSAPSAALQSISRDIVAPASLAEYERLQQALKRNQRAEVRYAIEHPVLGTRWLLTRVEPATLASGKRTTSVVTLDVTDQHTSQQRSEQLLSEMTTILESTTAGIAYLRDNVLVRCNRRFETMLGLGATGVAGSGFAGLFAGHVDPAGLTAAILRALDADETYETEFELALPRRDGPADGSAQTRWVSLSVRRAGAVGGALEAIAVLSDVTRIKTQQVELQQLAREVTTQAERTRSILDSVLVGIVTVGPEGIEWMNRSARRMFGGHLAEFVGQPIASVATPEPDHPFRQTHYLDDLVEGQAETFECRVRARDGREFWIVGNAVATGSAPGERQLTYALLDIERRRQAEAAMAEAKASLQRVIEAAPLAIALLDARSLTIVQVNEIAARLAGAPPAALIGHSPEQMFGADAGALHRADMLRALATREVTAVEYRRTDRGELQVWDARYVPLAAGADVPADQLLLVATDVTEQRAAQEARLEAAIAQREMLVKEVHHRIKNNLQGVAGLLQQIAKRKPEVAGAIDEVVGQVQAIAQVYGLQVGEGGPLHVTRVVEAITGSVQRTFGSRIRVVVLGSAAHTWTLPEVEAIPIALTINELLTNAIKHSRPISPEDAVVCTLDASDAWVEIAIASRGRLPEGFALAKITGSVSGLGLVRALLPRRSANLAIEPHGDRVVATVTLKPPSVARASA
ncbi:PAS domain S-box protein [Piscinibacter koreensis]|uniref:PAS domain S-box protein n=1 Tax=Piscinibacter koreensis TaxID=2742824 RepID=A0A7Y6TX60_9BURK|nr:PAS domain S-box protein [Schlegelella koreensis]NUZ06814.1 PAS domain S-box protein [Schlegelella koreensis]